MSTQEAVANYTHYTLASIADCGDPDLPTSVGAQFLDKVRSGVLEARKDGQERDEAIHQIADGAPNMYTYRRWQEFVDLAAWCEDVGKLCGGSVVDMTTQASVALYIIAERLASALWDELDEDDESNPARTEQATA